MDYSNYDWQKKSKIEHFIGIFCVLLTKIDFIFLILFDINNIFLEPKIWTTRASIEKSWCC